MIRRFLTVMLAMLVWTVQTADAGVDHSGRFDSGIQATLAVDADGAVPQESTGSSEQAGICASGCVCSVFHHALLDEPVMLALPVENDIVFNAAEHGFAPFLTFPPTRPPLV